MSLINFCFYEREESKNGKSTSTTQEKQWRNKTKWRDWNWKRDDMFIVQARGNEKEEENRKERAHRFHFYFFFHIFSFTKSLKMFFFFQSSIWVFFFMLCLYYMHKCMRVFELRRKKNHFKQFLFLADWYFAFYLLLSGWIILTELNLFFFLSLGLKTCLGF